MAAQVHQFPCLSDNYGVLLHDPATGATATIDIPEAAPVLRAIADKSWTLTHILVTHHHADHTQGIPEVRRRFPEARMVGPARETGKIGTLDIGLREGDTMSVGTLKARILETPGHTSGHIVYWFEEEDLLFAGDTLFALGCGRPFEERPQVLYHSLMKLAALPGSVQVYAGHEYTLSNARFAVGIDGGNDLLLERAREIEVLRETGVPTLPTTIAIERATNPFLRTGEPAIRAALGLPDADEADVFAALRDLKNRS